MDRAALIHAAFKGLAEGLMAMAAEAPVEAKRQPRKSRRVRFRTASEAHAMQMPLAPDLAKELTESYVAPNPRSPMDDYHPVSVQELDSMFQGTGNEAIEAFQRQLRMQAATAQFDPPRKPEDADKIVYPSGINDR